ncbi:hypothetical protein [Streptosporangium sp. NPDC051022]|uniref:hypothetical protein n=1 Tax=Streptosporangium sp. NPDC051022 TaxID=3155752 RepID=UPI0034458456
MVEPDNDLLLKLLADAVGKTTESQRLTIVGLGAGGLSSWEVHREPTGAPGGVRRPVLSWSELFEGPFPPGQVVVRAAGIQRDASAVLVCDAPDDRHAVQALELLRGAYPSVPVIASRGARIGEILQRVIADEPLTRPYDLVVLRRTVSGRPLLSGLPLFPVGARRGDLVDLVIRCGAEEPHGTVFAVVAASDRRFHLMSVESARLTPGRYELTAELRRPGRVRFAGLPAELRRDHRPWNSLVSAIPDRLVSSTTPSHLICAVEVSGTGERVSERLSRLERVIRAAAERTDPIVVSVISYGPHSFERAVPEALVDVGGWMVPTGRALETVRWLRERGPLAVGYPVAAQLECVLHEVARRIGGAPEAATALLTIGDRPAHPPRAGLGGRLPCPHRRDWAEALRACPGVVFAAIRDRPADQVEPVWHRLGEAMLTDLDTLDVPALVRALELIPPAAQRVPFPLMATE